MTGVLDGLMILIRKHLRQVLKQKIVLNVRNCLHVWEYAQETIFKK